MRYRFTFPLGCILLAALLPFLALTAAPTANAVDSCGMPTNPYGYTLCTNAGTQTVSSPPTAFCSLSGVTCIGDFATASGYLVQCVDGTFSLSGGVQGACSSHGGVGPTVYQITTTASPTATTPASTTAVPTTAVPTTAPASRASLVAGFNLVAGPRGGDVAPAEWVHCLPSSSWEVVYIWNAPNRTWLHLFNTLRGIPNYVNDQTNNGIGVIPQYSGIALLMAQPVPDATFPNAAGGSCSATPPPTPTVTPLPAASPTPTSPPTPSGAYVFTGNGQTAIPAFTLSAGAWAVQLAGSGTGNFIVWAYGTTDSFDQTLLVNTIGAYSGTRYLPGNDTYSLNVQADGAWQISVNPIGTQASSAFSGRGDSVSGAFAQGSGPQTFAMSADGADNFVVWLRCDSGDNLVENEIGPFSGSQIVDLPDGTTSCFWDIQSDGNWSITPQ